MADCGIGRLDKDQLQPANMEHFVWSWERDEPSMVDGCAALSARTGRWYSINCNTAQLPAACATSSMREGGQARWVLSQRPVGFEGAAEVCNATSIGAVYDHPWDGLQNTQLFDLAVAAGVDVLINYREGAAV